MVDFVVTGPIRVLRSKQPEALSHKYKKSLSPLGKIPHSFIRIFSLPHSCSKLPLLLLYSSFVFGFKFRGWFLNLHHLSSRLRVR